MSGAVFCHGIKAHAAGRLDQAAGMTYPDAGKQKAKEAKDFKAMRSELMAMQQTCEQLDSPVVFSHNDLLSGNIMVPLEVCHLLCERQHVCACIGRVLLRSRSVNIAIVSKAFA